MALPAGRYGVTKSMLQKIKNLPMDTLKMINELIHDKTDITVISENVEDGEKASKAYSIGDHFMRNGKFATVTAAIAINDTLTEGTNYTVGDVASNLLKVMTVSGSTTATGNFQISDSEIAVACAYCTSNSNYMVIPFYIEGTGTFLHVRSRSTSHDWEIVASTGVAMKIYYFD